MDEMGRTRRGTRKEAREAESARRKEAPAPSVEAPGANSSYAEVL
jgi:hypothetical protein